MHIFIDVTASNILKDNYSHNLFIEKLFKLFGRSSRKNCSLPEILSFVSGKGTMNISQMPKFIK